MDACRKYGIQRYHQVSTDEVYGDLPLDFQKDVFRILDTPKAIGLTLTDALLMMPSKSVTAIIGIGDQPADKEDRKEHKCETCPMTDCPYRDAD